MKAMSKKIATLVLVLAFACVGLVGCGAISIDEIKGDWTLDTIEGKSLADYASEPGVTEDLLYSNWTINDDKTVSSESRASGFIFLAKFHSVSRSTFCTALSQMAFISVAATSGSVSTLLTGRTPI